MARRLIGLAVACAFVVAGCGGGEPDAQPGARGSTAAAAPSTGTVAPTPEPADPTPEASATPTAAAPPAPDTPESTPSESPAAADPFVAAVRAKVPEAAEGRSDAEIVALASDACRSLRTGDDASDILARMQSLGTVDASALDEATARELVKLSIDTHCLEAAARVDEFGR